MSATPVPVRTLVLCIVMGIAIVHRQNPRSENIHAHTVRIFGDQDLKWAKSHFLDDLLYQAEQIKKGDLKDLPDNGMGQIHCEDPRDALSFLWDDLREDERVRALKTLGFPPDTRANELFKLPQPRWFSTPGVFWREPTMYLHAISVVTRPA